MQMWKMLRISGDMTDIIIILNSNILTSLGLDIFNLIDKCKVVHETFSVENKRDTTETPWK